MTGAAAAELKRGWRLDPAVTYLNHGSFGACPSAVLEAQRALREQLERQPARFILRELEPRLDRARERLAEFVGADPQDLAFVPNTTTGLSTVLRSLPLAAGDEILTTSHAYPACRNALQFTAARRGARLVVVDLPFPIAGPHTVLERVRARVGPRTKLAVLDHVTSSTGLVLPVAELVGDLEARGVQTLIDGAHAPGMIEVSLSRLGASYYTASCHKWLCAPKGSGFLFVRRDRQPLVRPLAISHGASSTRSDRSRFQLELDWTGTADPSPYLCVPVALDHLGGLLPGGWEALRRRNRDLALAARAMLCAQLGVEAPCPPEMIGALAVVPLPDARERAGSSGIDPLQDRLLERFSIEVPVITWPAHPRRWLRISAQLYNELADYRRLGEALAETLAARRKL